MGLALPTPDFARLFRWAAIPLNGKFGISGKENESFFEVPDLLVLS